MFEYLVRLPRAAKRLVMIAADMVLLPLSLWAAFALRLGDLSPDAGRFWWLFLVAPLVSLPLFVRLGLYRAVVRFMGPQAVAAVVQGVTLSALMVGAITLLVGQPGFPRSVLVLYWLIALLSVGGSRFLVRAQLAHLVRARLPKEPVVIYGAGMAGTQLAAALQSGNAFEPAAMVDDDPGLQGSIVCGVPVYAPSRLPELIAELRAGQVLLAIPSASRLRRRTILRQLEALPVQVKTIPGLADLVSGAARPDDIRDIDIADLLGRDPVAPDPALLAACVRDKSVMVTGAGGSIGGELCRQLLRQRPRRLVLFELSEFALYRIDQELRAELQRDGASTELVPLLGNAADRPRLLQALRAFAVDTVYHAAAYKHVPIVEGNVIEGVRNNVLGTAATAEAARLAGVTTFVLVSTDKAVRPANVMGASKRLAELVVQSMASEAGRTAYCIVRFGNVLDSSGSVVPLFREQIRRGGPLTVTHPEVTRYFMTIPEAAALVVQAGAMAAGGEVFVLDMGEPVEIYQLARRMIQLSGYRVRDERQPDGDIEIRFTGLRPGEKLHEQLLIGDKVTGTRHPMILRADEETLTWAEMQRGLSQLRDALGRQDGEAVRELLIQLVPGFVPERKGTDLLCRVDLKALPGGRASAAASGPN